MGLPLEFLATGRKVQMRSNILAEPVAGIEITFVFPNNNRHVCCEINGDLHTIHAWAFSSNGMLYPVTSGGIQLDNYDIV